MKAACVRCSAPPSAVLSYAYDVREAWLVDFAGERIDGTGYPLCVTHADRITPPLGWVLHDRRVPEPSFRDVA